MYGYDVLYSYHKRLGCTSILPPYSVHPYIRTYHRTAENYSSNSSSTCRSAQSLRTPIILAFCCSNRRIFTEKYVVYVKRRTVDGGCICFSFRKCFLCTLSGSFIVCFMILREGTQWISFLCGDSDLSFDKCGRT